MQTETLDQILNSDIAARFDITREQAERIADRATDGADFVRIWENEDWWVNEPLTFTQFLATADSMSVKDGAAALGIDVEHFSWMEPNESEYKDDDEIIIFDGLCYMSRRGEKYSTIVGRDEYLGDYVNTAKFLYFEHWVWECATHSEAFLTQFYNEWLTWQSLPESCAFELLIGAELTPYQIRWLSWFSDVWQRVVE